MKEIFFPLKEDCDDSQFLFPIYVSNDFLSSDHIIVMVSNSKTQPYIWSRSACIDLGIDKGSMLLYIKELLSLNLGIVVSNPYKNIIKKKNESKSIPFNSTPSEHIMYIYKYIYEIMKYNGKISFICYNDGILPIMDLLKVINSDFLQYIILIEGNQFIRDSIFLYSVNS